MEKNYDYRKKSDSIWSSNPTVNEWTGLVVGGSCESNLVESTC